MDWIIPGTVITGKREEAAFIEKQFKSMFMAGGIVLSQVSGITGLELPINAVTTIVSGVFGVPGIALVALLEIL